jgi:hypothetical protein
VWNSIKLRVIGSTYRGRVLWENPLRVAKPKKRQAHRDKALREVKGEGLAKNLKTSKRTILSSIPRYQNEGCHTYSANEKILKYLHKLRKLLISPFLVPT